jgi:hypothetical protein
MEISSNIIAIGATEGDGMILLIAQENMQSDKAKCICFDRSMKQINRIDSVAKATTFNAFNQLDAKKAEIVKEIIERELSEEQVYNINTYLQDEK